MPRLARELKVSGTFCAVGEQVTYTYDPSGRRIAKALGLIIDDLQLIIGSAWLAVF